MLRETAGATGRLLSGAAAVVDAGAGAGAEADCVAGGGETAAVLGDPTGLLVVLSWLVAAAAGCWFASIRACQCQRSLVIATHTGKPRATPVLCVIKPYPNLADFVGQRDVLGQCVVGSFKAAQRGDQVAIGLGRARATN